MKSHKTILIVEDDGQTTGETNEILVKLGYVVSGIAASGEEALNKVNEAKPDLILMDIKLKGSTDGVETAKMVNATNNIPIVYATAFANNGLIERLKGTNPYGYIAKPYKEAELHTVIELAFYKKEMETKLYNTQKLKSIETLAEGIAHKFNNALAIVTGNLNLMEMDYFIEDKLERSLSEIKKSAQTMTRLTSQLLAFTGGGKYQPSVISMNDFLTEIIPIINSVVNASLHVGVKLPDDILYTKIDINQLQSVMSTVLINASEAMAGSGLITITCDSLFITEKNSSNYSDLKLGDYICLSVKDTGIGMDEATSQRAFEPFFTTKLEGRGLGLAAAHGIISNHGGMISIIPSQDKGTIVKIYLPVVEDPAKKDIKPKSVTEWVSGEGVVLLVDDNEAIMELTKAMLKKIGYSVLEADSGAMALDIVNNDENAIDLVLLDIVMPDMNGNKVYPHIKRKRPDLPVIVFSGHSIDGPAREILDAGAVDFIQKPFTMADLSVKVKHALQRDN